MEKIFEYIDEHFDNMIEELQEICKFRSVIGDEEGLDKSAKYIANKMELLDLNCKSYPIDEGNPIVFGEKTGNENKTILFYNHYDIVAEHPIDKWKYSPFKGEIHNGKIYARGVSDNKGGLFSRLHAVEAILAVKKELPINVKFLVEGDEETGSTSLYRFAKEQKETFRQMTKADLCIWENGRKDEDNNPWVRYGVRGGIGLELVCKTSNVDVHARMGSIVPNAAWRLVWALSTLKDVNERVLIDGFYDKVIPLTKEDIKVLNDFPFDEEKLRARIGNRKFIDNISGYEVKEKLYTVPTLVINGLESGEMYKSKRLINPYLASAKANFNLVANQDPDEIIDLLRKHLDKHGFEDIEIYITGKNTPVRTPIESEFTEIMRKSAQKVYDKPIVLELTALGGGPGIVFREVWPEIPIIGIGPANTGSSHHGPNENLSLDDYKESIKHIVALLYQCIKK
ncbi:Acetylornithine deacetylase/Succinyl-diaminopimelate desuccinylase [Dethiosulfatibacter aminovorans DSM 17477]|uniref:Acetylornithine deacetylase/Succinyl-diaminopimelate desuccinylase n=1 Tax=Dethiosulfatibacter aminovorans DSM 17477 TaxID=1121476 RepID=A0A1M6DRQ2_9FIRM|nr:M20/M25/M40 family metallo-hydrolase [Dethiosulfatibacter aminovorans]SHI75891.1 Acetylornithine deacetylase/Succinyl-diaminopimelate desuccinylase [Dethiosulfatibacter aminovorans DSM 17477]